MKCRHCAAELTLSFCDLGSAPPSNDYLSHEGLRAPEPWYPLRVLVCTECWLAQTEDFSRADELFRDDYGYFSSMSTSWLSHAERYVDRMVERFGLGPESRVVEIAANDGYLLQYVKRRGIACLGVEPTGGTAAAARAKGIEIVEDFFGVRLAEELRANGGGADLTAANNVLAHVPDINDFASGFAVLLKEAGVATFEFPHLMRLVAENQFDTIYHEHYSYLSLHAVERVLKANGLVVFDVEELPTHGGSLRVFAQRADSASRSRSETVDALLAREAAAGMTSEAYYAGFQAAADAVKDDFLAFLIEAKRGGKSVAAYGAAAKGNTLMNYAGVRPDLIAFVTDRSPGKQGRFMPGSRIPIVAEDRIAAERPDYIVLLPWNLKDELAAQLDYARQWGARFVVAVPRLEILP